MWTGDMQSNYPTQWALNPSAYQNLPNEQVDWATLAQQWIKMKETYPADQVPPAPPPPSIKEDIAAGEAPMEISKNDVNPNNLSTSTSQDGSNWSSWNNWQHWNWGWSGSGTSASTPAMPADKGAAVPPYTYNAPANPPSYSTETSGTTTFDYNHGASIPDNFDQQGYWSGGPAPFIRNKPEWRSESRGSSSRRQPPKVEEVEPDTTTILDAAKRKQLPAWIREGLEKMEREKQKKLERERLVKERQEEMLRKKLEEEEAIAAGIPVKSKFDTDSEESEKETEETSTKPRKSRFDTTSSGALVARSVTATSFSPPPPPSLKLKSREEIMQEVMQQVRYVLTDLLMTVTNDEMQSIAEEVLADFRAKAPATQLRKTPALTSLTGKLGLGIYDSDSNSGDSSEESEDEPSSIHENGIDSDEELRERINRKKQEFARIERDIEHQVEEQEEREREREREREQMNHEDDEEPPEDIEDKGQVEPNLMFSGNRSDVETEEPEIVTEPEENSAENFTPERSNRTEKESSEEQSEDSERSSSSNSSSSSSSGSRYKKSRKSSKRRKERKSSKRKRKRSSSRGSDRRKSSYRKSSHRYEERHHRDRSRSRSRSRSRGYYDDYHRRKRSPSYRRHSSESSHKRRRHSYSRSPEYSRGKKSSHRSRD